MDKQFELVGIVNAPDDGEKSRKTAVKKRPVVSAVILALIVLLCRFCNLVMTKDPTYMDLYNCNVSPNGEFLFGTDMLGRDIFSMIWYGGRISLFIGFFSTLISTFLAIVIGSVSGLASPAVDTVIMRATDIFLSIPSLLIIILIQAILGTANALSISFVIGITSWTSIAKVVRTEVLRIRNSEYVIAARCMGSGLFHIILKHLIPNFISSIMFMVIMNIRSAIVTESTLSFMGMGLPVEIISWGSMLSLAERALMTSSWWMIVIPGLFLVATLLCITNIGNYIRKENNKSHSNL